MKTVAARILAVVVLILVLDAAAARSRVLARFYRDFGRVPERSALASWLDAAAAPTDPLIVAAVQTYVPRKFTRLSDGIWLPQDVERLLFAWNCMPSVFVEDEHYFTNFFSKSIAGQGITQSAQIRLFESGRELYERLETGGMQPFVLACFDREYADTNNIRPAFDHPIRIYANRFSFAPNLVSQALVSTLIDGEARPLAKPFDAVSFSGVTGTIECRWPQPVLVAAIHAGTTESGQPPLNVSWVSPAGQRNECALSPPMLKYHHENLTEQFLFFDEPQACTSLRISRTDDGSPDLARVRELEIIPPAPMGINTTRTFFEIKGDGSSDWRQIVNWRVAEERSGVEIKPGASREFVLRALDRPAAIKELLLVFAGDRAGVIAECRITFADGSEGKPDGRAWHSASPAVSWLSFTPQTDQAVRECRCRVTGPQLGEVPLRLIQVGTHLLPKPSDR